MWPMLVLDRVEIREVEEGQARLLRADQEGRREGAVPIRPMLARYVEPGGAELVAQARRREETEQLFVFLVLRAPVLGQIPANLGADRDRPRDVGDIDALASCCIPER